MNNETWVLPTTKRETKPKLDDVTALDLKLLTGKNGSTSSRVQFVLSQKLCRLWDLLPGDRIAYLVVPQPHGCLLLRIGKHNDGWKTTACSKNNKTDKYKQVFIAPDKGLDLLAAWLKGIPRGQVTLFDYKIEGDIIKFTLV